MWDELVGGTFIGIAAAMVWLGLGRISGMTSVLSGLFTVLQPQKRWALWFFIGLLAAYPASLMMGLSRPIVITDNVMLLLSGGFLVGIGTYIGNGCTSGHGVCGMGRLSHRSILATVVFMSAGIATVAVMNAVGVTL
ncbi:MAG: YeeE/YedE thiosulfate transporter family protein [Oleibacter sp.]|nr:YeeE/YedE thiosulfate transporter family protein [Thalassolituus sp.]